MLNYRIVGTFALAALLLPACAAGPQLAGTAADQSLRARDAAADPLPFQASLEKAQRAVAPGAVLASIQGLGLDQRGVVVPLLGGEWHFKYWVNAEGKTQVVDVVTHVEGHQTVEETRDELPRGKRIYAIDGSKILPPTKLVPQAIVLGLKISTAGAQYNYFDITYNPDYADPAQPQVDVADVTANYRRETVDKIRLSAAATAPGSGTPPANTYPGSRGR